MLDQDAELDAGPECWMRMLNWMLDQDARLHAGPFPCQPAGGSLAMQGEGYGEGPAGLQFPVPAV